MRELAAVHSQGRGEDEFDGFGRSMLTRAVEHGADRVDVDLKSAYHRVL